MKRLIAMMAVVGIVAAFAVGCGEEKPAAPATDLGKKVDKAAADASKTADKTTMDLKKSVNDATK